MKTENYLKCSAPLYNIKSIRVHSPTQTQSVSNHNISNKSSNLVLSLNRNLRSKTPHHLSSYLDRESIAGSSSTAGRVARRSRPNFSMKPCKVVGKSKKGKTMDYTNYAYNEAVGRLKVMLADDSHVSKLSNSNYMRKFIEDSGDNISDNLSVIERPVFSDISKYLSPSQKTRLSSYHPKNNYASDYLSTSKENLDGCASLFATGIPISKSVPTLPTESVEAPVEIFTFIEKQEDYIEQLEKESKYCRNELTNLLSKVKDVINENEQLTENARTELAVLGNKPAENANITTSSDSDEHLMYTGRKTTGTPRKSNTKLQSTLYASAPSIVYEARISELEAELMQANIDFKRCKTENEELKQKLSNSDPITAVTFPMKSIKCEAHVKQLELLQQDKSALEETVSHLQRLLDEAKSQQHSISSTKRYISGLVQIERSQAELEVRNLRDELDRQHERVRDLQQEMVRRLADERASAERRYNSQVDQLGGDLSNQWDQVTKLQLELDRQKRCETDLKRDMANRNTQIDELKLELRANRTSFLADMAQCSAEKQSLEQEITSLRLQLDRAARESKTEAARLTAEITSLRQRLDRGDADLLHSKREGLRLNDEIANLEKELAYGELKNEVRPTKKDLDKRICEMQDKHAETVNDLEEMISSQKQLMDKLTNECKMLTDKLEDSTYKHNLDKQQLRSLNEKLLSRLKQIWLRYKSQIIINNNEVFCKKSKLDEQTLHFVQTKKEISTLQTNLEYLSNRVLSNEEHMSKLETSPHEYTSLGAGKAATYDYQRSIYGTSIEPMQSTLPQQQLHNNKYSKSDSSVKGTNETAMDTTNNTSINGAGEMSLRGEVGGNNYGLNDNDDENLKDNLGMGEKQQQELEQLQQRQREREREGRDRELQQLREQREKRERKRDPEQLEQRQQSAINRQFSTAEQEQQQQQDEPQQQQQQQLGDSSISNASNISLGTYNTDYTAYDQQQYDASAYDPNAYNEQPYGGGQYGYDTNISYDYNAPDYTQSGYQYDSVSTANPNNQQRQYQPGSGAGEQMEYSRTVPSTSTTTPTTLTSPSVPADGSMSISAASRTQSRSSGGTVGPGTSGGIGSVNKSMPQHSATTAGGKK